MKYIFKFMFHRIFFVILAMLAQLFVLVSVLMKFYDYFAFFYVGSIILSIVVIFIILNNKSNPVYKMLGLFLSYYSYLAEYFIYSLVPIS